MDWIAEELVALVRQRYPDWQDFSHAPFVQEQVSQTRRTVRQAGELIGRIDFARLIEDHAWDEIIGRIERLGRSSNLLFTFGEHNDLSILTAPALDKSRFCVQLYELLHSRTPIYDRFDHYVTYVSAQQLPNKWTFPTALLFWLHPRNEIIVKPRVAQWFLKFAGVGEQYTALPSYQAYTAVRKNAHGLKASLAAFAPQDMVDVQALLWVAYEASVEQAGGLKLRDQIELDQPAAVYEISAEINMIHEPAPTDDVPDDEPYPLADLTIDVGLDGETVERWVRGVMRKGQVIFYGPPGSGKTFAAQKLARYLADGADGRYPRDGMVELVQFHPAYAYEDFVQGIRPKTDPATGLLTYERQPGIFLDFCRRAATKRGLCVLIIDEINRANLSQVFGELMYLLEYREQGTALAGGGTLQIPANVRLIGTMNTADRSIALVDHALRRRFAFLPMRPNYELLLRFQAERNVSAESLVQLIRRLNNEIEADYQIGMTYFLRDDLAETLSDIWQTEIEPYLEEYFFDRRDMLALYRWANISQEAQVVVAQ